MAFSLLNLTDFKGNLDAEIRERAIAKKVPIYGLDTASSQRQIMKQFFTLENLEDTLLKPKSETLKPSDYAQVNESAMVAMEAKMRTESPEFWEIALVMRNSNWLPKIEKILNQPGQHLMAVGGMHLYGDQGIFARLRRRGYTVRRL